MAQGGSGEVEAIRVAVRLKPLSANADYDEIDPQIGRAWRVLPDSNTIVQECPIELPAIGGMGGGIGAGRFGTPSKLFGTPSKPAAFTSSNNSQSTFTFDHVYGENSTTAQIYDGMVKDIVDSAVHRGINGTVFAYGQTSSGKSFTMQGSRPPIRAKTVSTRLQQRQEKEIDAKVQSVDGITHMAARDIFACIANDTEHTYAVRVSFMEIYNEDVRDLLVAGEHRSGGGGLNCSNHGGGGGGVGTSNRTLAVREDPKRGVFVENLTSHRVYNLDTLLHYLNIGEKHKRVAATGMNDRSSRSHTIFRITVERKKKIGAVSSGIGVVKGEGTALVDKENGSATAAATARSSSKSAGAGVKLVATLNLVDLAGSESVRHTGATGSRQKEGGKINQRYVMLCPSCPVSLSHTRTQYIQVSID